MPPGDSAAAHTHTAPATTHEDAFSRRYHARCRARSAVAGAPQRLPLRIEPNLAAPSVNPIRCAAFARAGPGVQRSLQIGKPAEPIPTCLRPTPECFNLRYAICQISFSRRSIFRVGRAPRDLSTSPSTASTAPAPLSATTAIRTVIGTALWLSTMDRLRNTTLPIRATILKSSEYPSAATFADTSRLPLCLSPSNS